MGVLIFLLVVEADSYLRRLINPQPGLSVLTFGQRFRKCYIKNDYFQNYFANFALTSVTARSIWNNQFSAGWVFLFYITVLMFGVEEIGTFSLRKCFLINFISFMHSSIDWFTFKNRYWFLSENRTYQGPLGQQYLNYHTRRRLLSRL